MIADPAARSPDEAAVLAAVLADLSNPLPKLVYADWLDDRDDPLGPRLRAGLAAVAAGRQPKVGKRPAGWEHLTGLALAAAAHRHGFADLLPRLLELARPAVALLGRPVGRVPVGASKQGGEPDLPADVPWPVGGRLPMTFLAQIDLAAVADSPAARELPPTGLLSAFRSIDARSDTTRARLVYTPPGTPLVRRPFPPALWDECRLPVARLRFAERLTVPCYDALRPADRRAVGDREDEYHPFTEEADEQCLLGHTDTASNLGGWQARRQLVALSMSALDPACDECDSPFWTITPADLAAGRLGRNRFDWFF